MDDFLSQIPAGLWLNCFLVVGGFFGLVAYYGVIRPRRVKRKKAAQAEAQQPAESSSFVKTPSTPPPPASMFSPDPTPSASATMPPPAEVQPASAAASNEVRFAKSPLMDEQPAKAPQARKAAITPDEEPTMLLTHAPKGDGIPLKKEGDYVVKLSDGVHAKATEVLSLMRDSADNLLMIHINGVAYRSLSDEPEIKKKFTALMNELARTIAQPAPPRPATDEPEIEVDHFVPVPPPPAKNDVSVGQILAADMDEDELFHDDVSYNHTFEDDASDDAFNSLDAPLDAPSLDDLLDGPPLDDLLDLPEEDTSAPPLNVPPRAFGVKPPPLEDGKMPGDISLPSLDDELPKKRGFLGFGRGADMPPVPELNIGEAIEAYLQHKLSYTPEFHGRNIHVRSAPGGGVRIEVDGQFYDAVGDVRDPDVRAFIQSAIQEWQDRQ